MAAPAVVQSVHDWARMIKLSHSVFALPFAVIAMFLAARPRLPSWPEIGLIVLCMAAARSAAMTFNRLADAAIDAKNPRTARREIPSGIVSVKAAWLFFLTSSALFVLGCAGFWWLSRNGWPLALALPVLAFLCGYSYTKRFTRWSHVVLGAGIAFAPVAAWIALRPETLGAPAWLLMTAVTFWIGGFDIIYGCQDAEFDRAAGLHSLPARLGIGRALVIARCFHVLTVAALVATGIAAGLGTFYFAGVGLVAVLLTVENLLVSADDLSRVNLAFFTINGVVGVALGAMAVVDIVLRLPAA